MEGGRAWGTSISLGRRLNGFPEWTGLDADGNRRDQEGEERQRERILGETTRIGRHLISKVETHGNANPLESSRVAQSPRIEPIGLEKTCQRSRDTKRTGITE